MSKGTIAVVGAGIVGLAIARSWAVRGYRVLLFERSPWAVGASVRNFGMVWPVGQPSGTLYNRAIASRGIWQEVCRNAGIWHEATGSLHAAHHPLEAEAMQALAAHYADDRAMQFLTPQQTLEVSPFVQPNGLLGALWSPHEVIVESREAIGAIRDYLCRNYAVESIHTTAISRVENGKLWSGQKSWEADLVFICTGTDFETLYPELFYSLPITKCKLQMMRLAGFNHQRMGAALCGGLSLIHYKSFAALPIVEALKKMYETTLPEYVHWGIHVMACQNPYGDITIGDTHEYGWHHDPFDKAFLNKLVVDYLGRFTTLAQLPVAQSWNGMYAKMTDGSTEYVAQPDACTWIVNGLGGAGMTLSFGLAEEIVGKL